MSTLKLERITGQEGLGGAASPITFSGDTATLGSTVTFPAGGTGNPISIAIIADQKVDGENGGEFACGAWRTRD